MRLSSPGGIEFILTDNNSGNHKLIIYYLRYMVVHILITRHSHELGEGNGNSVRNRGHELEAQPGDMLRDGKKELTTRGSRTSRRKRERARARAATRRRDGLSPRI